MNTGAFQKCAAQHFGPWMVDPKWFAQAVSAVKAGTFKADTDGEDDPGKRRPLSAILQGEPAYDSEGRYLYAIQDGVAQITLVGQITKGDSSFGGASTTRARWRIREANNDRRIRAILLVIDSPGGTVSGTGDLADDVYAANANKPVYTYFEDLGASAAYWIGSQARRVFANPTAEVGSIGTMTYVEDTSGAYEKAGIKVTLIATGPLKGQWIDGNPVSDDYIASLRTQIEDLNAHFQRGVMRGRGLSQEQMKAVSDGNVFIASKAKQLGLVDDVCTLQTAMAAILKEISIMPITAQQFSQHAAENPTAAEVTALVQAGYDKGVGDGKAAAAEKPADVAELEAAFPGEEKFVLDQLKAKATMTVATKAFCETLKARNKTLAARVEKAAGSEQGPVESNLGEGAGDADGKKLSAERRKKLLDLARPS